MSAQQAVEMTAKLYEARDAARTLLGDKYKSTMAEYGDLIKQVMKSTKVGVISAATLLCRETKNPYRQLEIFAAAVELVEPSDGAVLIKQEQSNEE